MAAIDKLYGSPEQWEELRDWLMNNYPSFLAHMYPKPDTSMISPNSLQIANFSLREDGVLLLTCPLEWITDRLVEQYGLKAKFSKVIDK